MRFEKVLPALRRGKHVRRPTFPEGAYIEQRGDSFKIVEGTDVRTFVWFTSEILAKDWEIVDAD